MSEASNGGAVPRRSGSSRRAEVAVVLATMLAVGGMWALLPKGADHALSRLAASSTSTGHHVTKRASVGTDTSASAPKVAVTPAAAASGATAAQPVPIALPVHRPAVAATPPPLHRQAPPRPHPAPPPGP